MIAPSTRRVFLCRYSMPLVLSAIPMPGGCTAPTAPPPEAGVTDVAMRNIAFTPKEVTIRVGETVRWTNLEAAPVPHTVTSGRPGADDAGDLFDSGDLSPSQSFQRTFDEAGEFLYFCVPHQTTPAMVDAVVTVVEE